ncbi:GFA family protein [Aspergillus lucknowensis]|uniref:Mss4-like protein n=1 Tax=Aspergillus lucknowensis TaxID=176173 RepID=A0ABR4LHK3_9EURO
MPETKTLTARCHCRAVHFTLTIPTTSLPLDVHICNCTLCRTLLGAPASFHAPLPKEIEPEFIAPSSLDKLTPNRREGAPCTIYFCSTCGCHIGDRGHQGGWTISVSIFEEGVNDNESLWKFNEHWYTDAASTGDGGFSQLLPRIDGREVRIWNPDTTTDRSQKDEKKEDGGREEKLLAQCSCGGVSFNISRPRQEFVDSPLSEGWVHAEDPSKWLGLVDVCTDCRLVNGAHVVAWLFVSADHISPPLPEDLCIGTSKRYESSPGVVRTFCGRCGATVFFTEKRRGRIVDIATGILRGKEGFMLADWARWRTARLGYPDDGIKYDRGLTEGLTEGLQEWGRRTHGVVRDFAVGTETGAA